MFEITQWDERYEVNSKGDAFTPGAGHKRRGKGLDFIRSKVHGRQLGTGMRKLQLEEMAGDRHNEVFGLFLRFLEIAGDASKSRRGRLLNSDSLDDPATAKDLAFILNSPQEQIDYALTVLLKMGWISGNSEKLREPPGTPGSAGNSENSPPLNNETESESNLTEQNETEAKELTSDIADAIQESESSFLINEDDSDSDSALADPEVTATTGQIFLLRLVILLPRWSKSDKTCFENLAKMLADMIDAPNTFGEALVIARECRSNGGDNPKQAFMARVQKHFDIKLHTPWRSNEAKREQMIKKTEAKE